MKTKVRTCNEVKSDIELKMTALYDPDKTGLALVEAYEQGLIDNETEVKLATLLEIIFLIDAYEEKGEKNEL